MRLASCLPFLLVVGGALQTPAQTIDIATVTPATGPAGIAATVTVSAFIPEAGLVAGGVNLQRLNSAGAAVAVIGTLSRVGHGNAPNTGRYQVVFSILENAPTSVDFRVSAAYAGKLARVLGPTLRFYVLGSTPTGIAITTPVNLAFVSQSPQTIRGTVGDPAAVVTINGVSAPVNQGQFMAQVPLIEGANTVTAVSRNSNGSASTASIQLTLDTTPPRVSFTDPASSGSTGGATMNISGIVNDIVVGTVNKQNVSVTVNGRAADVRNRTFKARDVPLSVGLNTIQAVARDQVGNSSTASIQITRESAAMARIQVVSGDNQAGTIGTALALPLRVRALAANGAAAPNVSVVFRVKRGDGKLTGGASVDQAAATVNTDSQGYAEVRMKVGTRAGAGNNAVEASATGFVGSANFSESANPSAASRIVIDSGNSQFGVVGQNLALPLIAVVTDAGFNRIAGVNVVFTVRNGGGTVNGFPSVTAVSDSDGRVLATLKLGGEEGNENNLVEATFAGNTGSKAIFTASGRLPGDPANTKVSGVVLDNSSNPIAGVTMRLFRIQMAAANNVPQQVATPVTTNAQGMFTMTGAPVGAFKLMADGSTAGPYPTLEYDLVTVAGRDNNVGQPIYLPKLDVNNKICVTQTSGGVLTLPQVPGFALTVLPGSATFPGGSKSGCVSVSVVNGDKVPMTPGFGQQPRFIVTIQPVGTIFNPPAPITIPNVDGLPARAVTEMYSYDHDLASFVAIGTGSVSDDASVIASDIGVGVLKAGWHCGGNPNRVGAAATCPECQECKGEGCVAKTGGTCDDGLYCTSGDGQRPGPDTCNNGNCEGKRLSDGPVTSTSTADFGALFNTLKDLAERALSPLSPGAPGFTPGTGISGGVPQVNGAINVDSKLSCCEVSRSFKTVNALSGNAGVQLEFGIGIPLGPLVIPGIASVAAIGNFKIAGTFGGSGYIDPDQQGGCRFPNGSIEGKVGATSSIGLGAFAGVPGVTLVSLKGTVGADGFISISSEVGPAGFGPLATKGCLGPVKFSGEFQLLGLLTQALTYEIPNSQICTQ